MFNKIIKYIITLLLSIIIFCIIPKEFNPIANIYLFVLLGLLVIYFFDTCSIFEYFDTSNNIKDLSNNNIKDLSNNNIKDLSNNNIKKPKSKKELELELEFNKRVIDRIEELKNIYKFDELKNIDKLDKLDELKNTVKLDEIKNIEKLDKLDELDKFKYKEQIEELKNIDLSNINCKNTNNDKNNDKNNNNKLILLNNIHDNINNLLLSTLEKILYNENTIKYKSEINEIILSIKSRNDPSNIYTRVEKLTNLLKDSNSELYDLFKNILLILTSIINQKPIVLNNIHSEINNDIATELYIKKHFLPLFENMLLVILSYNKLPNHLQSYIKDIINLINNDTNISNILKKSKEINKNILIEINDKEIISDKVAKTYLLMSKAILDVIIKKIELLILNEPFELKNDIQKLNKELKIIMKTHLGKILKLNISLENDLLNNSNIKTYLLVDFNSSNTDTDIIDESNIEISDMLKQLANKLDTNNSECNCENKVKEAVDKYLKNGKYIDDNGIIKNIMNSDMIYNQLDVSMLQSLGSYDNSFSNKWDKGYTYLDTSKWTVPKVQIPNPPNINNIMSSLTPGYPINLLEFDNSRKVLGPDNINLQYIKEKLN
jgi:hypothetical protein